MTIGLGIFLAGIAIGLAILLQNARVRRVLSVGFVWIVATVAIGGFGFYFYNKQNDPFHQPPTSKPQLLGITLGDSRMDIIYKLGEPSSKTTHWDNFASDRLSVNFENGFAKLVIYKCSGFDSGIDVNGISCGTTLAKIKEKFKDKVKEYCVLGTPTERVYLIPDFNTMYVLKQNAAFLLSLRSGSAPISQNWISCNAAKYFD